MRLPTQHDLSYLTLREQKDYHAFLKEHRKEQLSFLQGLELFRKLIKRAKRAEREAKNA